MSAPALPTVPAGQVKEGFYWSSMFLEVVEVAKSSNGQWVLWRVGDEKKIGPLKVILSVRWLLLTRGKSYETL